MSQFIETPDITDFFCVITMTSNTCHVFREKIICQWIRETLETDTKYFLRDCHGFLCQYVVTIYVLVCHPDYRRWTTDLFQGQTSAGWPRAGEKIFPYIFMARPPDHSFWKDTINILSYNMLGLSQKSATAISFLRRRSSSGFAGNLRSQENLTGPRKMRGTIENNGCHIRPNHPSHA